MSNKTLTYTLPEQSTLTGAKASLADAEFVRVNSQESLESATALMNQFSANIKALNDERLKITRPMDEAKKNVMDFFRSPINLYEQAVLMLKTEIKRYFDAEEAKRRQEQARLEAEARAERERLLAQAKEAETVEEQEAIEQVAEIIVPAAPIEAPKAKGVSVSKKWRASVDDVASFLEYVAEHPELHSFIKIENTRLDRHVANLSGQVKIPGVRVYQESIVSNRTR